ncbi:hypothetical protein NA78x_000121 [Anatilimnocola sp. NA78]|uniref:hypothetical protein n=1 Tax=Anatilimnocola sp. NA78 TaxID=3415683 RepID=UPI003CE51EDD
MTSFSLVILCKDGSVQATFTPPLELRHYDELLEIVRDGVSIEHLRQSLEAAARSWQVAVRIEPYDSAQERARTASRVA